MTEYINRDAYIRYLSSRKAEFVDDYGKGWSAGINTAIRACEKFPAVDVVPLALLEKWLYEIAFNNLGTGSQQDTAFAESCEEIINRLDGLRAFIRDETTN